MFAVAVRKISMPFCEAPGFADGKAASRGTSKPSVFAGAEGADDVISNSAAGVVVPIPICAMPLLEKRNTTAIVISVDLVKRFLIKKFFTGPGHRYLIANRGRLLKLLIEGSVQESDRDWE